MNICHDFHDDQDDCISVGDDSEHMLFERINASGIGLVTILIES